MGCGSRSEQQSSRSGKLQGLHQYKYPDGQLYLEVNYKDSLAHGVSKQYFKNGQVFEEAEYRKGILHGVMRRYHEDGKLSAEIPYDSGRMHGVHKKFRKDGTPAFEAPYYFDKPCLGLKEYFTSGRLVDNYPRVVVKEKNELLKSGKFSLQISLSENHTVQFYKGELTQGKFIGASAEPIPTYNGVGELSYFLPPGGFIMERVNIIAKIKTDLGNYYITQTSIPLAVEYR